MSQFDEFLFNYLFFQKRMRIKKLPTILALHLKRFKYMEQYNRHIKVSHRVVFPLELRLFNTVRNFSKIQFSFFNHFSKITVRRCCESGSNVRFGCCCSPLWFRTQPWPLYFHCQILWILANF